MRKKIYIANILITAVVLAFGLGATSTTSATVPGVNEAVSISTSGGNPNSNTGLPEASQDGRYIVFKSMATNLVSPSPSGNWQIYIRDRLNNTTSLVSVSSSGVVANTESSHPAISANGRYVVFVSTASNLVAGDTNGTGDVFIHDMSTGTTQIVSTNISGIVGNDSSSMPDVDKDGNYVVFTSYATNLVASPSVSSSNVYEKNMSTGEVKLLSQSASGVDANKTSYYPKISCEGRFVVFQSNANNLVSGDTYNPNKSISRIYLVDMLKPIAPMYIMADPNNMGMADPSITCNGDYISFDSGSSNIVPNDTNGMQDGFVYDRINGTFELISVNSAGAQGGDGYAMTPSVSSDGKYAAFYSTATNMVASDTNGGGDIFLRNRQAGTTELVSKDSNGTIGNARSSQPAISYDGRYVTYWSAATNLVSNFGYSTGAIYVSQTGISNDY